jgi:hypothetical protein
VWLQQAHETGGPLWPNPIGWRGVFRAVGPARDKLDHYFPMPLALGFDNWKTAPSIAVVDELQRRNFGVCVGRCYNPTPPPGGEVLGSMRDYLHHVRSWIEVDDAGIASIERENDDNIMDLILQSKAFQPAQIRMLNYCRLYLGAVTLLDLTTTNGIYLDSANLKVTSRE